MNNTAKIFRNLHDAKPYWVGVKTKAGFWQQVSKNYVTYRGAERWAVKNHYIIEKL